jgi:hypothetical protein
VSDERDGLASRPRQAEGLELNEVADGLVIYHGGPERVHYLNRTASLVFELCTGEHSPEDIARLLGDAFSLVEPPSDEVRTCLDQLRSLGVVR